MLAAEGMHAFTSNAFADKFVDDSQGVILVRKQKVESPVHYETPVKYIINKLLQI